MEIVEIEPTTPEYILEDGSINVNLLKREVIIKGIDCEVTINASDGRQMYKLNINGGSSVVHVPEKHSCELKAGNSSVTIII